MRICLATSELHPFSKTGGLADVSAALGRYLSRAGVDIRVFTPLYSTLDRERYGLVPVDFLQEVPLDLGGARYRFSVYTAPLPNSDLWVYFIHCPALYDRGGIYTNDPDEHLRFLLLSRAVFECCQRMAWSPQVLHCNDWQTALVAFYRRWVYAWDRLFADCRSVLTIHNIGYQGVFGAAVAGNVADPAFHHLLHQDDLKRDQLNFLKTGLLYADAITTVSPTYAAEIQTPEFGAGLEGLLREHAGRLTGILNGVDYDEWSPEQDRYLSRCYGPSGVTEGKATNKKQLLDTLHLPDREGVPLVGVISRLVAQKGFELLFDPLPRILKRRALQLVILGSGERRYEEFFRWLQVRFPRQVCFYKGYHNPLAHLIEAASDIFLMPSRYEPCGLNQMYSLKYGTIPVVRRTGGLADSVSHYDPATGQGTGFLFEHFTSEGLRWALELALDTYADPDHWPRLVANAMAADFSWERQVGKYLELYQGLIPR